jgi:hypothetical protein
MIAKLQNVAPFYEGWRFTNHRLIKRVGQLSAYHCAEIGQTLGMHGLPEVDIWTGRAPILPAKT